MTWTLIDPSGGAVDLQDTEQVERALRYGSRDYDDERDRLLAVTTAAWGDEDE